MRPSFAANGNGMLCGTWSVRQPSPRQPSPCRIASSFPPFTGANRDWLASTWHVHLWRRVWSSPDPIQVRKRTCTGASTCFWSDLRCVHSPKSGLECEWMSAEAGMQAAPDALNMHGAGVHRHACCDAAHSHKGVADAGCSARDVMPLQTWSSPMQEPYWWWTAGVRGHRSSWNRQDAKSKQCGCRFPQAWQPG